MKRLLASVSLLFSALTVSSAGQLCCSVPAGQQQETIDELRARYDVVVVARRLDEAESYDDIRSAWSAAEFQLLDVLKGSNPPLNLSLIHI